MESIQALFQKIKSNQKVFFLVALIILVALCSYALGRISKISDTRTPVEIERKISETKGKTVGQKALLIGSVHSNKYHYPWCAGAARIKESNVISFQSEEEARAYGYVPAGNCPGL